MFHIIVNPVAGRGHSLIRLSFLVQALEAKGMTYEVIRTAAPGDGYDKAYEICLSGSCGIIGIGGDGTVQEIVAGMADANAESLSSAELILTPLAILPCGSGNDFVMSLKKRENRSFFISQQSEDRLSAKRLVEALHNRKLRNVDIIKANGMAFLNIGNIGLDARIVRGALRHKKKFGKYAYLAAVYESITHHENLRLIIQADGKTIEGEYTFVAICNGRYYGGGMPVAPDAEIDDGKITVCLVEAMSRAEAMLLFPTLLFSLHTRLKKVRYLQ